MEYDTHLQATGTTCTACTMVRYDYKKSINLAKLFFKKYSSLNEKSLKTVYHHHQTYFINLYTLSTLTLFLHPLISSPIWYNMFFAMIARTYEWSAFHIIQSKLISYFTIFCKFIWMDKTLHRQMFFGRL